VEVVVAKELDMGVAREHEPDVFVGDAQLVGGDDGDGPLVGELGEACDEAFAGVSGWEAAEMLEAVGAREGGGAAVEEGSSGGGERPGDGEESREAGDREEGFSGGGALEQIGQEPGGANEQGQGAQEGVPREELVGEEERREEGDGPRQEEEQRTPLLAVNE